MISKEEVKHIAKLARLGLSGEEIKKFQKDLSAILDYFEILKEVNISKVESTFHPAESFLSDKIREDKIRAESSEAVNKLVESAPERKNRYIKIKNIF